MVGSVALIQLPHFYGEGLSRPPECYPLGLGYLSSMLSAQKISHVGIDLWGPQLTPEKALEQIDFSPFTFFAISAYSTQYKYLKDFSLRLKNRYPHIPILCGGPGATFSSETILRHTGVDACVLGEGEITLPELCLNYENKSQVPGISYLENGTPHTTPAREYIKNLDEIPFPNRELFDFSRIMSVANQVRVECDSPELKSKPRRSADIVAGRGCPYNCHFCSKTFQGVRLRSIANIIDEVKYITEKYQVNHLLFNDELVLVNKARTLALCEELKKFQIPWSCQGRINQVDEEILKAMSESGCTQIGYGIESATQDILDRMNKNQNAADIVPVIKMTQKFGITPIIQYMYGYPGENDESIARTKAFFTEIDHPYVGSMTTPIPGSRLYHECVENNLITDEEDYLLRLDSGYNLNGTYINLTKFTTKELLQKKRQLLRAVTHSYFKKRPVEYLRFIFKVLKRKISMHFKNRPTESKS